MHENIWCKDFKSLNALCQHLVNSPELRHPISKESPGAPLPHPSAASDHCFRRPWLAGDLVTSEARLGGWRWGGRSLRPGRRRGVALSWDPNAHRATSGTHCAASPSPISWWVGGQGQTWTYVVLFQSSGTLSTDTLQAFPGSLSCDCDFGVTCSSHSPVPSCFQISPHSGEPGVCWDFADPVFSFWCCPLSKASKSHVLNGPDNYLLARATPSCYTSSVFTRRARASKGPPHHDSPGKQRFQSNLKGDKQGGTLRSPLPPSRRGKNRACTQTACLNSLATSKAVNTPERMFLPSGPVIIRLNTI